MKFGEFDPFDPSQRKEISITDEDITKPLSEKFGGGLSIEQIEEDVYDRVEAINNLVGSLEMLRESEGSTSPSVDVLEKQLIGIKNQLGGYLSVVVKEGHNLALREEIEGLTKKISDAIGTIQ
ncbi:MAG: hypothetical protein WC724_01065 [Candidatus Paceibacterota bacterium]|jgi:hypothetical protein